MKQLKPLSIFYIVFIALCLFFNCSHAQPQLWGMTQSGGATGSLGVIFKTDTASNSESMEYSFFASYQGANPLYTKLLEATDANLYGITSTGGANNGGVIFQYNPATGVYTKKFDFGGTNGSYPQGSLIQASDGMLYGMTASGGANSVGVLFQFNPFTNVYTKKFDFGNTNGTQPAGSLIQAADGMIYGITYQGGANNYGTIFQYNLTTSTFTKKIDMSFGNGGYATNSMIEVSNGVLYGMTQYGGIGGGTIFEYNYSTNTYTKKYEFTGPTTGFNPNGDLIKATDGNLYGMAYSGGANSGGVLFQYNYSTNTFTKKFDFGSANGRYPCGSLIQATDGMLYGLTKNGGQSDNGTLFQYNISTDVLVKKCDFSTNIQGHYPSGTLVQAANGMLYGLTSQGGEQSVGVLFQYNPTTSVYQKKVDLNSGANGLTPTGSLVQANDGMLYGMTSQGGQNAAGVLFQYNPSTQTFTKKIDFADSIGTLPKGSLMKSSDGMLYGLTFSGGANNFGTLFQYNPANNTLTKKFDFDFLQGAYPMGTLIEASDGMLYGTALQGGTDVYGVLFQYNIATNTYTKKRDFSLSSGALCYSGLIQASDGMLYGMTYANASGAGSIFQYNPTTNTYTVKYNFYSVNGNGNHPYGLLTQGLDGKLYGLTYDAGANGYGTIFQYNPETGALVNKYAFDGLNGQNPKGSLLLASDGLFYGLTTQGGANNVGVMFQYNPVTNTYTKKFDFNATNGSSPLYTNLIDMATSISTAQLAGNSNCAGGAIDVPFATTGIYNSGNVFTAQLSDSSGSFTNAVDIGTLASSNASGTIHATLPFNSTLGTHYRIRVVSSNPAVTGHDNGSDITINPVLTVTASASPSVNLCTGDTLTLSGTGAVNYTWTNGVVNGTSFVPSATATYIVTGSNGTGCNSSDTITVAVNPHPLVFAYASSINVCAGNTVTLTGIGSADTYTWTGGVTDAVPFTPTTSATYTVTGTDANGCSSTTTKTVNVKPVASSNQTLFICAGDTVTVGTYHHTTSGIYTDVLTAANGCDSTVTTNLTVNDVSVITSGDTLIVPSTGATYQWLNCNSAYAPIGGQTNHEFVPSTGGSYAVAVTKNSCVDTSACELSTVGITENNVLNNTVRIYPNPFSNQTTIAFDAEQKNTVVKITDVLGKEVRSINFTGKDLIIEKDEMNSGIYFVKINNEKGATTHRIIID